MLPPVMDEITREPLRQLANISISMGDRHEQSLNASISIRGIDRRNQHLLCKSTYIVVDCQVVYAVRVVRPEELQNLPRFVFIVDEVGVRYVQYVDDVRSHVFPFCKRFGIMTNSFSSYHPSILGAISSERNMVYQRPRGIEAQRRGERDPAMAAKWAANRLPFVARMPGACLWNVPLA
jgi:hypothetical protein